MNADRIRAAADAMARELGAIFPVEVAQDCANNLAQSMLADVGLWRALKSAVAHRGDHLRPTPAGLDPLDVYARVGVAWIEVAVEHVDDSLHLFALMIGHGFPEPIAKRAMQRRAA